MTDTAKPVPLATLARAGDTQTAAVANTPFIFMARDISNAYLVTTDDGDLMVNTGFFDDTNQTRNAALLKPHRTGSLRHIVLTQSHADHFGGVPVLREAGTKVIGGPGYSEAWGDMNRLQPFFGPRSNAGKTVHELMRAVALPDHFRIGQFHGKVSWAVKTIWEEYAGWLHYEDGTTELYGVPRSAVNADLCELAGGAGVLAKRAQVHAEAGRPLEAIHLFDVALGAEPQNLAALKIKNIALDHLLVASGNTKPQRDDVVEIRNRIRRGGPKMTKAL